MGTGTVFISYAREDTRHADRLYMDLRAAKIDAWLDTRCLLPGQEWRREIPRVIRGASYFIALISQHSLNKRGFVQAEIKRAITVMAEIPTDKIFMIPVRIEDCYPADEELQNRSWVDLFPNYQKGLERILSLFRDLPKSPLEFRGAGKKSGARAPIHYTPYRSFSEFAKDLVERLPRSSSFADPDYAMYIRYKTKESGVVLPASLAKKYPDEIKVVLQNQFDAVTALRDKFTVVLWFDGKPKTLVIPYTAVLEIEVPTIGLRVEYFGLTAAASVHAKSKQSRST